MSNFTTLYFLLQKTVLIAEKLKNLLSYKLSSPFVVLFPWIKHVLNAEDCIGLKILETHFHFWLRQKWKCEQNITHDLCLTWCWLFSFPKFGNKLICFYDIWAQIWIYLQLVWSNHIQRRLEAHVKNTMSHHLETDIKTILVEYWELNYFGNTKNVNVNI